MSLACAMSRATTIVPVRSSGVETGCFDSSARISAIGRLRSIGTPCLCSTAPRYFSGRKRAGSRSSSSSQTPSRSMLRLDVAVRRARDADADRARGAVARQADDAHVEREVLAAELRADPGLRAPARGPSLPARGRGRRGRARCRSSAGGRGSRRGQLDRLHRRLGRGAADRRTPGGTAGRRPCRACASSRPGTSRGSPG